MKPPRTFAELRAAVVAALEAGEPREAFLLLRPLLDYPGNLEGIFVEALDLFARVGALIAGEDFAGKVRRAALRPDDPEALYALGYELVEHGLSRAAATILLRAHQLAPTSAKVLAELSCALENDGANAEAARLLGRATTLVAENPLCRYLLAWNAAASGDLATTRRLAPLLARASETDRFMAARVDRVLARADALAGKSPLDARDLRGWHHVLTGGILLHLSPHGLEEPMRGRYAWLQDSPPLVLESLRRLATALTALGLDPARVFALPGRESEVLALAVGRLLERPVQPWPGGGSEDAGILVAYDLERLEGPVLASVRIHRPGQVLFAHATRWTSEHPFVADLTSILYQELRTPWDSHLQVDPETRAAVEGEPDVRAADALASDVLGASLDAAALADEPALEAFVRAVAAGPEKPAALCPSGPRERFFVGSPVASNRFN